MKEDIIEFKVAFRGLLDNETWKHDRVTITMLNAPIIENNDDLIEFLSNLALGIQRQKPMFKIIIITNDNLLEVDS